MTNWTPRVGQLVRITQLHHRDGDTRWGALGEIGTIIDIHARRIFWGGTPELTIDIGRASDPRSFGDRTWWYYEQSQLSPVACRRRECRVSM